MDDQYTNENLKDKERRGKLLCTRPPNTNPHPQHHAWQQNSVPRQFDLFFIQIFYIFIFKSCTHIHTKKNKFQDEPSGPW